MKPDSRTLEKELEKSARELHERHGEQLRAMGIDPTPKLTVIGIDLTGKSRMFKHLDCGRVVEIL